MDLARRPAIYRSFQRDEEAQNVLQRMGTIHEEGDEDAEPVVYEDIENV